MECPNIGLGKALDLLLVVMLVVFALVVSILGVAVALKVAHVFFG